ncbi:hook-length control protein FliK [Parasphingorhabdus marina DSM 22363]|uniref:Hook-length control protein FliK n=1 Tax=Parasphingorhabdus marina DSM 22363 TaxID=1123272 RepID=A0A1N6CWI3_9SPHN|nr:flagellar hook-length control protein FliK [Parasphingorhabdus marina]SIN62911.1 hook-length control protein FliK [Parasphingorhabdus marina DSM 22363]
MEISFLKTMVMPSADKSVAASAVGTVPAFPEGMLNADTRTGEQSLSEEAATDGNSPVRTTEQDAQQSPTRPVMAEDAPFAMPSAPNIVLYPGFAADQMPKGHLPQRDMAGPADADDGSLKLADIDPQTPIMPYRTARAAGAEPGTMADFRDASIARAGVPDAAEAVSRMQQPDARDPKIVSPLSDMSAGDGEPAVSPRGGQVMDSATGGEKTSVPGPQTLAVPQRMPSSTGSRQTIDPVADAEPSGDTAPAERLDLAGEFKKLQNPASQMENMKQSMPLAAAANGKPEKLAEALGLPENADPEAVEVQKTGGSSLQAPTVGPMAGLRLRQSPTADASSGLQVDAIRSPAASASGTKAADIMTQASTMPADAVLEFDSAFIENLTREISLIANSKGIARFSLKPEHLGRIDVEIRGGERGDDIKLVAETESVKQFLIQSQSRLEQELRLHGQRLTDLDIGAGLNQGPEREARESLQAENFRNRPNGSSDDEPAEQQYHAGNTSGQTSNGARYA